MTWKRLLRWWCLLVVAVGATSASASHLKGYDLSHTIATSGEVTFIYKAYHVNSLRYPTSTAPITATRYLHFGDGLFDGQEALEVSPAFVNCQLDALGKCRIEYSDCLPPGDDASLCDTSTTTRVFQHVYACTSPSDSYTANIAAGATPTAYECCRADAYHNIPNSVATNIIPVNTVYPCCDTALGDPNSGPVFTAPPVFNAFRDVRYLHPLGASDIDGDPLTLAFLQEVPIGLFGCSAVPCPVPPTPNPITLTPFDHCQTPTGATMGFATSARLDWNRPKRGTVCNQTRLGYYAVGTSVTDTCGATASREFRLELFEEPTTSPPLLSLAPQVPPGLVDICIDVDVVVIDVTGSDADAGDTVTLSVTPSGVPNTTFTSTPGNPANGVFTFAPKSADLQLGTHGFTFRAQDDGDPIRTALEFLQVVVVDCGSNLPPIADAGGPYVSECSGQPTSFRLDGTRSSDPEMGALTYAWSTNCPGGAFDDATIARPLLTLDGNPPCPVDCTVTLLVTDPLGLSDSDTDSVTIEDTLAPILSGLPADATVECDKVPLAAAVTAADGCAGAVMPTLSEATTAGRCPHEYTLVRTWTAIDSCGNAATGEQRLTVVDTTLPTLHGVPANVTVECDAVPVVATVTVTDNCSTGLTPTYSESRVDGPCADSYALHRRWRVVDECGNETVAVQIVTVVDTTKPVLVGVPADVTVECDAVPAPAAVTASDNCDPGPSLTLVETRIDGSCADAYTLVREWTAIDRCGNAAITVQRVNVRDTVAPSARALLEPQPPASSSSAPIPPKPPASASSACSASSRGAFKVLCGGSDNCDPSPSLHARFRVTNHDAVGGVCSKRVEDVEVFCDEVVELRLLAPPCPASGPKSPAPPVVVSSGLKVISGEVIVLQVVATDRCGNEGVAEYDPMREPAPCPLLESPPDPKCKEALCGRCAAAVSPLPKVSVAVTGEGCDRDTATAAALAAAAASCVGVADPVCAGSCRDPASSCAPSTALGKKAKRRCERIAVASCRGGRGQRCDVSGEVECGCACAR